MTSVIGVSYGNVVPIKVLRAICIERINGGRVDKVSIAKDLVRVMFPLARCGIFSTSPVVGDTLSTIYEGDGLTICICYRWRYFKVWGLTREEFQQVEDYYSAIWKNYMTERYSAPQQSGECSPSNQERQLGDGGDKSEVENSQ